MKPLSFIITNATALALAFNALSATRDAGSGGFVTEAALQEPRVFQGEGGNTLRGRVVAYNRNTEIVTIAEDNGRTHGLDLDSLSPPDRTYIREWHRINSFFTQLHITLYTPKEQDGIGEEYLIWHPEKKIVYDMVLENRSSCRLQDLTLEYFIDYELDQPGNRDRKIKRKIQSGLLQIDTLEAGAKTNLKTDPLLLPKGNLFEYYKDYHVPIGRVKGIRIRIYLPLRDDRKALRELSFTGSLMKNRKWIAPVEPQEQHD